MPALPLPIVLLLLVAPLPGLLPLVELPETPPPVVLPEALLPGALLPGALLPVPEVLLPEAPTLVVLLPAADRAGFFG